MAKQIDSRIEEYAYDCTIGAGGVQTIKMHLAITTSKICILNLVVHFLMMKFLHFVNVGERTSK